MAIKYKSALRKNPVDKSVKYYPASATPERIEVATIAAEIEESCTLHESDIMAVVSAFTRRIVTHLQNGHSVNLGDLGTFRTSVTGKGVADVADVTAANIRRVRLVYTPSTKLRAALRMGSPELRFERVASKYDKAAAGD